MRFFASLRMTIPFVCFEIKGQSMLPTFQSGDRVLVFRWGSIAPGDVIVFCKNGLRFVKRAVAKNANRWSVRGDNWNASTDSLDFGKITEEEIIGRVVGKY